MSLYFVPSTAEICNTREVAPADQAGINVGTRRPFKPLLAPPFHTAMRAWPNVARFAPCDGHFQVAPIPLISRNLKGFEHPLDPTSPPPRSRRLLRSPLLRRNKTDRLHGAKPIEGEDTCRGVLASCRGTLGIYRQTLEKSNNNDAAVLLGKGLPDNRGRFAGILTDNQGKCAGGHNSAWAPRNNQTPRGSPLGVCRQIRTAEISGLNSGSSART